MSDIVSGLFKIRKIILGVFITFFINSPLVFASNFTEAGTSNLSIMTGVFMVLMMLLVITLVATEKVHRTLVGFSVK